LRARIIRSSKRIFDCWLEDSQETVQAVVHASILKEHGHVVVGDVVIIKAQDNSEQFEIIELVERESELYRRNVREKKKKVIAANVDFILIVSSVSKPEYKPNLIDRYLLRAVQWDIPAVVILNKMDEFDNQFDLSFEKAKFEKIGVKCFEASATSPDDFEFRQLQAKLKGETAILMGQSGVGKSKLISSLSGGKVDLLSNELAKGVGKGAHTTTWSELIDCGDFMLIDSPGVRSMALSDLTQEELPELFPDLYEGMQQCKFPDCKHEENSKGCYFHQLGDSMEDQITLSRLNSFLRIRDEISEIPDWQKTK
jgi:ribosome biogenesis GTPase